MKLRLGDTVSHKEFPELGDGQVVEVDEEGLYTIQFAGPHSWSGVTDEDFLLRPEPKQALREGPDAAPGETTNRQSNVPKAERRRALISLRHALESDFLAAREALPARFGTPLSEAEIESEVVSFIQGWFHEHGFLAGSSTRLPRPDPEQSLAIGVGDRDTLVVARAGSGKTATIVNRAYFLQRHCAIAPEEMLLLAFNKKAAAEMKERLEQLTGSTWPHVMTFHALAWALVRPTEDMLFDEEDAPRLRRQVQQIVDMFIRKTHFRDQVRELMLSRWRKSWEDTVRGGYALDGPEMLKHRRLLVRETIRGDFVKSHGEKVIANFLFEHGVPYRYEAALHWSGRVYRPDFTHYQRGGGVVIEYFGLRGEPGYDAESQKKVAFWRELHGWDLIEVYPEDLARPNFNDWFRAKLRDLGVVCERLSEEEIWRRAEKRAHTRFAEAVTSFIQRARKRNLTLPDLKGMIHEHVAVDEVEAKFLGLVVHLYGAYLAHISEAGQEDFDGLLARAAEIVRRKATTFARKSGRGDLARMKHIFIDEYQDFSPLFYSLVDAIRTRNRDARYFCVGDDWQAINAFAGAELRWFRDFETHFPGAKRLSLSTNYRSRIEVVQAGNNLMRRLGGAPARASRGGSANVVVADLSRFRPRENEGKDYSPDFAALLGIVSDCLRPGSVLFNRTGHSDSASKVVLLSRTSNLPWALGGRATEGEQGLGALEVAVRRELPVDVAARFQASTVHKYKGLQAQVVVVADALEGRFPLVHPDWRLFRLFGDSLEKLEADERRLFYVALTRAEDVLVLLTDMSRRTPFLDDAEILRFLDWSQIRNPLGHKGSLQRTLVVGNDVARLPRSWTYASLNQEQLAGEASYGFEEAVVTDGFRYDSESKSGTYAIKEMLKADGFRYDSESRSWRKTVTQDFVPLAYFRECAWAASADGVEVSLVDANDKCLEFYVFQNGIITPLVPEARR